jgi:hypothetical protein
MEKNKPVKKRLGIGTCYRCSARETIVLTGRGYSGICNRCDPKLYTEIAEVEKEKYLRGK